MTRMLSFPERRSRTVGEEVNEMIPGFTALASLDEPSGHYSSAYAFTDAGESTLRLAQAPPPHPPLMPWGSGSGCFRDCEQRCQMWCGTDFGCRLECRDPWCFVGCNLEAP
jgi:hypothetical protein